MLLVAGAAACGGERSGGVVPWVNRPLSLYVTPEPKLVRYPTSAPPCRPGQLRVRQGRRGAALSNDLEELVFTNTSTRPCLLRGYPTITAETSAGTRRMLRPQRGGTYFGQLVASDLRPGGHVFLDLATGVACNGGNKPTVRYHGLVFTLAGGGRVPGGHVSIDDVCGLSISTFGLPERYAEPRAARGTAGTLKVTLRLPQGVRAGTMLSYTVVLSNPTRMTVVLRPCPGYTQSLYSPTAMVHGSYALDCDSVRAIHPHERVRYAMRLAVPGRAKRYAKIGWSLDTPTGPFVGSALPVAPR